MNQPRKQGEVIVVGAGPSGLAAAYCLQKRGISVKVLDAADRVGAKMRTTPRDGFLVDQGAFFLPTTHRRLLGLAADAGMADQIVPGGFILATMRDGEIHNIDGNRLLPSVASTRLLSWSGKLEAVKLLPEILRARHAVYERMPECGAYDTQTLAEWAAPRFSPELRGYLIDTTLRGIFATSAQTSPRVDFLAILALLKGAKLVAFKGGMGAYAEGLARGLDVRLETEVTAVEPRGDGVRVHWRAHEGERSEDVAGCIVAVPALFARQILPALDPWRREFLKKVRHGRTFVLNVALRRSPPGVRATYIQIPKATHPFVTGIMLDHHKAPGRAPAGKGLLSVAFLDSWCDRHWDEDDDSIRGRLLHAVDTLLPGTIADAEFVELHRWFQEYNTVGFYRDLGEFRDRCKRDTHLQLAGDFHSMQNLDAATTTGIRAAERLLATIC